jgi:poly(3-hydroxybutyrate) depolymerase
MASFVLTLQAGVAGSNVVTLQITSTVDGTIQPCLFLPAGRDGPRPLLVLLHHWSHGYDTFDFTSWRTEAEGRGWHLLVPHYRGPNDNPMACASPRARQDILDAVEYVRGRSPVDPGRIYLAGESGGGHMAMVMAGEAPDLWAGVSVWCGISDLTAWHRESEAAGRKYAQDIEAVCGGAPGSSAEADAQLKYRSPVHHLAKAKALPVDISTGIHDGHTGSVPIHHTLDAFNVLAEALGAPPVTQEEIDTLSREELLSTDEEQDATYGREIHLRRYAGPSRVTIFEGGHEGIAAAGCAWLEKQERRPG